MNLNLNAIWFFNLPLMPNNRRKKLNLEKKDFKKTTDEIKKIKEKRIKKAKKNKKPKKDKDK